MQSNATLLPSSMEPEVTSAGLTPMLIEPAPSAKRVPTGTCLNSVCCQCMSVTKFQPRSIPSKVKSVLSNTGVDSTIWEFPLIVYVKSNGMVWTSVRIVRKFRSCPRTPVWRKAPAKSRQTAENGKSFMTAIFLGRLATRQNATGCRER